ncbi:hypothetical protein RHMOL_Rhmol05G0242100 [Rhododendron molle]|uniref:Uncharacterized protein n=2 Tax=Rhododendron molle TaxID=49168 RepID=A0ACC0NTM1_RHOML|nr:hypothetical protein RHMOL_Rhmol05G0242100 [Rhododendron molle]KAI8556304.1 hypothetical protein RHMOL_Rhmol05G0242100 [Rhododendron molle]
MSSTNMKKDLTNSAFSVDQSQGGSKILSESSPEISTCESGVTISRVMDKLPGRIAFIGDGPYRGELEKMFSNMPAVFTGMLGGKELSRAYASRDVFLMPSESETLGLVVL